MLLQHVTNDNYVCTTVSSKIIFPIKIMHIPPSLALVVEASKVELKSDVLSFTCACELSKYSVNKKYHSIK